MSASPAGLLLISTNKRSEASDDNLQNNLLFAYTRPSALVDVEKLKNLATAVAGASRAAAGQEVQSMLLARADSGAPLRIAFVHTKELLVVQLQPGQLCSATATAAALWLMHMLLFLLGPLSGWLQQPKHGTGLQLSPWCSQQLLQLLPVLMLPLHNLLLQPTAGRLLLSVGLPAVQLPQQLQQQLWMKLSSLTQQLPGWLPVAEPVQQQGQHQQQQQQQQQLMRPSCCLFASGCLLLSSVRPWAAQRLWGLAWSLGLHHRTEHHPPALLLQHAYNNLAAPHQCSSGSSAVAVITTETAGGGCSASVNVQELKRQQLQQDGQDEQMRQQLEAFDCVATLSSAESMGVCSMAAAAAAGAMVRPCTVVMACFGTFTLMVVTDRLRDPAAAAAAAHGASAAATSESAVLHAVASCAQQLLMEHGTALQQQLDLSQLPGIFAVVPPAPAAPASSHEQQQQQQKQQKQSIVQLRPVVTSRHARVVSDADMSEAHAATPSKALGRLQQLLLCGHTGCRDVACHGSNSPAALHGTASTPHLSHILSNPGTPTAAAGLLRKQHSSSSSSSPFKGMRDWLLAKGFSQQGFSPHQAGFRLRSSSSSGSSQCSTAGSLSGSLKKAGEKPFGGHSQSSRSSSRLCSTFGAGDRPWVGAAGGVSTVHRGRTSADGVQNNNNDTNSSNQQQALLSAAAGGWRVVHGSQRTPAGLQLLPGDGKGTTSYSSTSTSNKNSNKGTKYRSTPACHGSAEQSVAAAGAAVLAVDRQQGTFSLAAPPPPTGAAGMDLAAATANGLTDASRTRRTRSSSSSSSAGRFVLDAAATVRQLLARVPPAPDTAQSHKLGQQQQQRHAAQYPAINTATRPGIMMPVGAASATAGTAAFLAPAGNCTGTPLASARSTGPTNHALQQQQQRPLLPVWSLVRLERHAAVAGNSSSGVAVLDARPEPWREQLSDGCLSELLAGLRHVQLDR